MASKKEEVRWDQHSRRTSLPAVAVANRRTTSNDAEVALVALNPAQHIHGRLLKLNRFLLGITENRREYRSVKHAGPIALGIEKRRIDIEFPLRNRFSGRHSRTSSQPPPDQNDVAGRWPFHTRCQRHRTGSPVPREYCSRQEEHQSRRTSFRGPVERDHERAAAERNRSRFRSLMFETAVAITTPGRAVPTC